MSQNVIVRSTDDQRFGTVLEQLGRAQDTLTQYEEGTDENAMISELISVLGDAVEEGSREGDHLNATLLAVAMGVVLDKIEEVNSAPASAVDPFFAEDNEDEDELDLRAILEAAGLPSDFFDSDPYGDTYGQADPQLSVHKNCWDD